MEESILYDWIHEADSTFVMRWQNFCNSLQSIAHQYSDYVTLKQAKNGWQSWSRCHGLSWTVMDYFHGLLSSMIVHDSQIATVTCKPFSACLIWKGGEQRLDSWTRGCHRIAPNGQNDLNKYPCKSVCASNRN